MRREGVVNLPRARWHDGRCDDRSERRRRILGKFGEFAPCNEPGCKLFAIERGAYHMPLQCEMLPDLYRPEAREKLLCAFRVAKAAHATLAFARRLMAVLDPVVQPGGRFYEHVLHVRKFRDFGLCGRITAQLIGDDLARYRARAQHTLEETFGCGFSRRFCSRISSSAPCSSTARHSRYGSPRSVTNISSRCHVLPGLRRAAFTR